ncbi:11401_t:CDS:2, partial [Funneliformis geosporum]
TPDGICIVAFVKEQQQSLFSEVESSEITRQNHVDGTPQKSDESLKHRVNLYSMYILYRIWKPANKVVGMPSSMQSLKYFKFTILQNRQFYLTTIDINNGVSQALIVKNSSSDDHPDKSSVLVDTGKRIDDPIVKCSEILHDFNESVEVLLDFDVKLYDEHEPFRRVSRVQEWFTQNTAKSHKTIAKLLMENMQWSKKQEIGHGGKRLCQSSRHYCGKACSLQKSDYHCPNK